MSVSARLQPFPVLWLTAVWVLLWGDLSAANVLSGLVLAVVVLVALPLPRIIVGLRLRPVAFVVLLARFLLDVVVASMQVAWLTVRPGRLPGSSVITVQLRSRDELMQTVVGEMMSLVPGSLVVDLDGGRGLLSMHVLGVETREQADALRGVVLAQERRVLSALAADPDGGRLGDGSLSVGGPGHEGRAS